MTAHARLSASSSERWINCPASMSHYPFDGSTDVPSKYAEEGTYVHALCELYASRMLEGHADPIESDERYKELINSELGLKYHSDEADDNASGWAEYLSKHQTASAELWHTTRLESRVSFDNYVQDGFGTPDAFIVHFKTDTGEVHRIDVFDYKNGRGFRVDAENNTQGMLYALGVIQLYDAVCPPGDAVNVGIHIVQPNSDNISYWSTTVSWLREWGANTIRPTSELAYYGKGGYAAGSWCRWCAGRGDCKTQQSHQLNLLKYDFDTGELADPDTLIHSDIEAILRRADDFRGWLYSVQAHVKNEALHGRKWIGFKVVSGRASRVWKDEAAVSEELIQRGFDEDSIFAPRKLLGIRAIEKLVGKKRLATELSHLWVKPAGKPALVPDTDPRPEISTINDFE